MHFRGRANARDLLLFRREDRLRKGRKATCRTRQSHMHFGSQPKCTCLRFFLVANARVCCSVEARRGCGRPEKQPPCILAECLNARGLRLPSLGWAFTRRFEHAKDGASQPSRMQFSTDSKRICSPHSGMGVWGHVGPLDGDLGTHKPLRHNRHEYVSARILNASAVPVLGFGSVRPCWALTSHDLHSDLDMLKPYRNPNRAGCGLGCPGRANRQRFGFSISNR